MVLFSPRPLLEKPAGDREQSLAGMQGALTRRDILKSLTVFGVFPYSFVSGLSAQPGFLSDREAAYFSPPFPDLSLFGCRLEKIAPAPRGFFSSYPEAAIDPALPPSMRPAWGLSQNPVFEYRSALDSARLIHRWFHQAPYRPSIIKHRLCPSRQSPSRFLAYGADSEDHALARYTALTRIGFPPENLQIAVLHQPASQRAMPEHRLHTVLCLDLRDDVWILDPLQPDLYSHKTAISCRLLFVFDSCHTWQAIPADSV